MTPSQPDGPAPQPPRYEALDSLRGVCAMMVVLYHLHPSGVLTESTLARNGWLFVDFFFVLSGFVIATSYGERLSQGFEVARFMGLRLGRVYPLHLFVLGLLLILQAVAGEGRLTGMFSLRDLWLNIFLLQSFGLADHLSWNGPAWSIAAEVWTYLIFALVASRMARWRLHVFAVIGAVAFALIVWRSTNFLATTYDLGFARCLFGFAFGVIVERAHRRWPFAVSTPIEIGTVAAVILFVSWIDAGPATYLTPPLFALAVLVFAQEGGRISTALRTRPFRWLGTLSYGIYMLHLFALARYFEVLGVAERASGWKLTRAGETTIEFGTGTWPDRLGTEALTICALLFVALVAWFAWRFVEMPTRTWSRKKLSTLGDR